MKGNHERTLEIINDLSSGRLKLSPDAKPIKANGWHEPSVGFDYAAVDRTAVPEFDAAEAAIHFSSGLLRVVRWINSASGPTARSIRAIAVECLLTGATQAKLGRFNGITRAAISKAANAFRDEFELDSMLVQTPHMRRQDTREKFSKQCTLRHKKKKSAATSNGSSTKLTSSSMPLSELVRKRLKTGDQQLPLP